MSDVAAYRAGNDADDTPIPVPPESEIPARLAKRWHQWTINGDFLALKPNGVARHARETVLAMDRLIERNHPLARDLQIDIVAPRAPDAAFQLKAIPLKVVEEFRSPRLPQFWVQMQLPLHVEGGLVSFCNLAPLAVPRQIVCIHDLHTYMMPESYGRGFRWLHRLILPAIGRRARRIATVSAFSRDCLDFYGVAPREKVSVVYNGADHALRWNPGAHAAAHGRKPFVLCLGQPQPYKNLKLMLTLLPALAEMGLDLAIAGEIEAAFIEAQIGAIPDNLRLLGRVSDDDLAKALKQAHCFLFPSRIEGFGMPVAEAMMLGCPVIASRAAAMPELFGDAILYCEPDAQGEWIATIQQLAYQQDLRTKLAAEGPLRAARYNWRSVAESYLRMMASVDLEDHLGSGEVVEPA